ncbi:MAG: hypothetical protein A2Y17_12935 [Clostridiales bacterium GWF2_38_85]|nr:MAG: hypothetical protein A2Y17_12935 [Clostridiales bacterium GWF2_38_85]HBL84164.1 hypothetical protein [Clostridiales bacterium]
MPYIIAGGIIVLIILYVISTYNRLVNERLKVGNQWSQVNIILKQRTDLIPNIVNTVSGYASHEKEIFNNLSEARARSMSAKTPADEMKAAGEMSAALGRLFAVAEAYPDLKANVNFLELQHQLTSIEKKIADFRQFYNDIVMRYNKLIITIPSNIIASMFKFEQKPFFQITEAEAKVPEVKF